MALFTSAPRSMCILRLSAIGDVCHAIAVVQAIQSQWPQTRITWVCGKIEAQLLQALKGIEVVVFDKKDGYSGMKKVWQQLGNTNFDVLLHMQAAIRASVLSVGIKAKYKVGFGVNRTREWQRWFTNRHLAKTNAFHVLDNFAEFARYIGVDMQVPHWAIPLDAQQRQFAELNMPENALVISPAASKDERNWQTEKYAKIADWSLQKGVPVVLCGSPAPREIALGESIVAACAPKNQNSIINLIGQTNLLELVAVLHRAKVVLAPDTGPAHLATTQGTPVVGLYAHSNPLRTGPYNNLQDVVSVYEQHIKKQKGRPVEQLPWGTRAKGGDLMHDITVDMVAERLERWV